MVVRLIMSYVKGTFYTQSQEKGGNFLWRENTKLILKIILLWTKKANLAADLIAKTLVKAIIASLMAITSSVP